MTSGDQPKKRPRRQRSSERREGDGNRAAPDRGGRQGGGPGGGGPGGGGPGGGGPGGSGRPRRRRRSGPPRRGERGQGSGQDGQGRDTYGRDAQGNVSGGGSGGGQRRGRRPDARENGTRDGARRRPRPPGGGGRRRDGGRQSSGGGRPQNRRGDPSRIVGEGGGYLVLEKGGNGVLRREDRKYMPSEVDIFVPRALVDKFQLVEGSHVEGTLGENARNGSVRLVEITAIDGRAPDDQPRLIPFKKLTTIDPLRHFELGEASGKISMRILDLFCPIGHGQRGLVVAPPRSGKTTILRELAEGITKGYPKTKLMVLLIDERPEEATEWRRAFPGCVYAATADQPGDEQTALAEVVWKRAMRLVELGEHVVMLLDSITRLARVYNRQTEGSGRTMTGGVDARAMERPRQIFGAARNTEDAGSLTIIATALIETGSRMDDLIFQEFKGTGNAELVLSREMADKRIFPAIDITKSGTRKEEKLITPERLNSVYMLRRVISRMKPDDAMEKLLAQMSRTETTDQFLKMLSVER